jgi:nucleoside-diphosphate-sugar epimerase
MPHATFAPFRPDLSAARRLLRAPVLTRVVADLVLVNVALAAALAGRALQVIAFGSGGGAPDLRFVAQNYVHAYTGTAWLLTFVSSVIFFLNGFYTHRRAYMGRYKLLIVAESVSLTYVIFGALLYLLPGPWWMPPTALVLAWVLTMALLVGARIWALLWRDMVCTELEVRPPDKAQVRRVLVIGGAGYIGSALVRQLLDKGYEVRVLDQLLYGLDPIRSLVAHPRLEVQQGDFRQVDKVVQAMRGIDAVVHLGGIVGDPACALDEELTIEVNVMATRLVAEVAKMSRVNRLIFASSCSVYGAAEEGLDERSLLRPVSLYARSKIASERLLAGMADEHFSPIILRFATIYGLSGRTRFDLVVNLLTAKAVVDGEMTVFGGDQWRPFVHVQDAAGAILSMIEAPLGRVRNQVFNVGSEEQNYTINQVAGIIKSMVPGATLSISDSDGDRRDYRVRFDKIRRTVAFTPAWTIEQGIEQVMSAIESGQVRDYRDPLYSNAKFLTDEGTARIVRRQNEWAFALIKEVAARVG